MAQENVPINIEYDGFQIAVQLVDYRSIKLTDEDRSAAETQATTAGVADTEQTRAYLLQAALIGRIADASVFRVPKPLAHERALAMGRALEQKLEMDQLTLDGYLAAMKTTKETLISDFEVQAKQQLRQRICLLAIAKAEGLEATDAEYAAELERLSSAYPVSEEELIALFSTSGESVSIKQDIAINKAATYISTLV